MCIRLALRSGRHAPISRCPEQWAEGGKHPHCLYDPPMPVTGHMDGSRVGALRKLPLSPPARRPRDVAVLLSSVLGRTEGRLSPSAAPCLFFRPPAVKTVYCMSEAELVDVALGVLIQVESAVSVLTVLTAHSSPAEARLGPWLTSLEQTTCVLGQPQGALSPVCPSSTCPLSHESLLDSPTPWDGCTGAGWPVRESSPVCGWLCVQG